MRTLLDLKTNIVSFVEKYEYYALCIGRFVLMLSAFLMVHFNICYFEAVDNVLIPIMLAVLSAVLPMNIGLVILELYCLVCLWGFGLEVVAVVAVFFLIAHLLYFRFAKGTLYRSVLTPVLMVAKVPYILPITCGLRGSTGSIVSVLVGMVIYSLLSGLKANEAVFLGTAEITATDKIILALNQILKNKEIWIVLFAFFLTYVLVFAIRRLSIKNAWKTAYLIGIAFNMIVILCGKLLIGKSDGIIWLLIGSVISIGIAVVYEFIFMDLDYSRVEQVQFEDDNYYYYVKAVPKIKVEARKKSVMHFNQSRDESEE